MFTIRWTRRSKLHVRRSLLVKAIIISILILVLGFGTNTLPYLYKTVECMRLPVESSRFMAGYDYKLPGDEGYGIHIFSEYNYCTQADIEATHGYHHSTLTSAGRAELEKQHEAYRESQKFVLSKLDFQFYVPDSPEYTITDKQVMMIHSNAHAFYTVLKGDKKTGQIRELKRTDSYNICASVDPQKRYCRVIGKDSMGREVNREYDRGIHSWNSYYVGINIGETGIILSTDDDQEAIKIFGAMKLYTE